MKFNIIAADPPWNYQNWTDSKNGAASSQYETLKADDIASLPVADLADDNCALLLWATHPKIKEALAVMEAWGFRHVSTAFNWVKTNADGSPYMGIGFYTRGDSEPCLLGIKGSMKPANKDVRQTITSPRTRHSAKPNVEFRKRTLRLFGDLPRVELFSRFPDKLDADGWVNVGNEVDGQDIRLALPQLSNDRYLTNHDK